MTPFDRFLEFLVGSWRIDVAMISKGAVLLFLGIYIVFALVVVKQIKLMSQTINGAMEEGLIWAARGLVVVAGLAFILGLIIL